MDRREREESAALLEALQVSDRSRARQRLQTAPDTLTTYERTLLGVEYRTYLRQQAADRETAARATRHREAVTAALCPPGIVFRNDLLRQLNHHAIDLVVHYGLTVKRSAHDGGWGSQASKTICVPAATSEESYSIIVHEVGHAVDPEADSRQYRYFVEGGHIYAVGGELAAWRFAFTHACVWTVAMLERMYDSVQHHPAFRSATPAERGDMVTCLTEACFRVTAPGPTWTFERLAAACGALRKGIP